MDVHPRYLGFVVSVYYLQQTRAAFVVGPFLYWKDSPPPYNACCISSSSPQEEGEVYLWLQRNPSLHQEYDKRSISPCSVQVLAYPVEEYQIKHSPPALLEYWGRRGLVDFAGLVPYYFFGVILFTS